jgi:pyruvate dehydrogenase E1 component alpha subunit
VSVAAAPQATRAFNRYLGGSAEDKALGLYGVLSEDGAFDANDVADIDRELAVDLYRGMLLVRTVDARMMKLQRQGRIGFYGEALGQEASVVGTAAALAPQDWLVPALREAGSGLYRGLPLHAYIAQIFGNANDVSKGRQMPCHPGDRKTHYVPMSSCVASQLPHAVGIAMGMKIAGAKDQICVGYMGDGGTSEEDFHCALNFAGVSGAPVVLVCQNNQWAISTPGKLQTSSPTIAVKGIGYGVESLRADGNDVLAVYQITRYAAEKARRGDGPTFIELLTYRVGAHSSSDDPSRYRDESITENWKTRKDPLRRMSAFLDARGWLPQDQRDNMLRELDARVSRVVDEEERVGPPDVSSLIEDVFEQPPWHLREQLQDLEPPDR